MDINWILIKQIAILSAFFGAAAGILTIIPYIGVVSFVFVMCFMAPVVIWLLIKYGCITLDSVQKGIITGAIAGFVAFMAFSVFYVPISWLLMKFFTFSANYGVGLMFRHSNLFLIMVIAVFMSTLSMTINAFSGFVTYCIIDLMKSLKK